MIQPSDETGAPGEDEPMRYAILGEDTGSVLDKLEKYTAEIDWDYLKKPFAAGSVLYVDPSLDLMRVGEAFANDESDLVRAWKQSGDLVQPSAPHAAYWEETSARFTAVVISPFVLIQPVGDSK